MVRDGRRLPEMPAGLQIFYIEMGTDDEQCGDGAWLAKMKSTRMYANSSKRIKSSMTRKIRGL